MGDSGRYRRLVPVRAAPEGTVHYEDKPIPVNVTLRVTRPDMQYTQDGWVVAWTRNAVLVVWWERFEGVDRLRSGWLPPADVSRAAGRG